MANRRPQSKGFDASSACLEMFGGLELYLMGIHGLDRVIARLFVKLEQSTCIDATKEAIADYIMDRWADGRASATLRNELSQLRNIAEEVPDLYLPGMTKRDVRRVLGLLGKRGLLSSTLQLYKQTLRSFLAHSGNAVADDISITKHRSKLAAPEEILTMRDIAALIDSEAEPRNRAIIAVLWDSGCRIGELGGATISDVAFDNLGASLSVTGKTGPRRIRLVPSVPHLLSWFDVHPRRHEGPDTPLWVAARPPHARLGYGAFHAITCSAARNAGIDKPATPHAFRRARATALARELPEAVLKRHFGWTPGSGQLERYIRLSNAATEDAILALYGIDNNTPKAVAEKTWQCWRCGRVNVADAVRCVQCAAPSKSEDMAAAIETIRSILSSPEVVGAIAARTGCDDEAAVGIARNVIVQLSGKAG